GRPPDSDGLRHDSTLTTFAQLGCHVLDCQRSFISLIDHKNQYILAEATKSVSLQIPELSSPGDHLYLGARVLDLVWGVCPDTIHIFNCENNSMNISTPNIHANRKCYIINDISKIECFQDREYVAGWPNMRFYAEVPIRTTTGLLMGSYCIVDNKLREGLDSAGIRKLAEIANAVTHHLELVQAQKSLECSREMVKGLSLFAEGRPSITHTLSAASQNIEAILNHSKLPVDSSSTPSDSSEDDMNSNAATTSHTTRDTLEYLQDRPIRIPSLRSESGKLSAERTQSLEKHEAVLQQDLLVYGAIKALFSRHLMRETSDLDGIIFVNASLQDITLAEEVKLSPVNATPTTLTTSSASDNGQPSTTRHCSLTISINKQKAASPSKSPSPNCELLGFSLANNLCGSSGPSPPYAVWQSILQALLTKYPHGHIFLFSEDGSPLHCEDIDPYVKSKIDSKGRCRSKMRRIEREKEQLRAYQLLDICPGARAIIFFPLWDPQRGQWFAGSLAWTKDPGRILQSEDVTYLAGFGSCIMAERSRMDAMTADLAKGDFISSISHELRSPLHGMLATLEALEDAPRSMDENEMLHTATTCGERRDTFISAIPTTIFDFSILVENVVEGIFAGHSYGSTSLKGRNSLVQDKPFENIKMLRAVAPRGLNPDVMVILDVERQVSWLFESQVGAWKRILTNLFVNALKYTEYGYVRVTLRLPPPLPPKRVAIVLEIEDSGIGMSQDFLRNRLYPPFAQANPLSVGTGLGLSIVRQLVTNLDGTIDIQSEIGHGTKITVTVSLKRSAYEESDGRSNDYHTIRDIGVWSKGLTLFLIGFDYLLEMEEASTGILSVHARRMLALKSSLTMFAVDFFGMRVVTAPSTAKAYGEILVGLQSQINISERFARTEPMIVFEDVFRTPRLGSREGIFYLSQPAGPHKIARILGSCLEYKSSLIEPTPTPTPTPTPNIKLRLDRTSSYGFFHTPAMASPNKTGELLNAGHRDSR
ncbi:hypothetical protein B0J14DRAFT_465560, partial [Halenospora varia]